MEALQGYKSYLIAAAGGLIWLLNVAGVITPEQLEQGLAITGILFGTTVAAKINRVATALKDNASVLVLVLGLVGLVASSFVFATPAMAAGPLTTAWSTHWVEWVVLIALGLVWVRVLRGPTTTITRPPLRGAS